MPMILNLKDATYLDDASFLKIILSSADNFPGLYRFNSPWKKSMEESNFLKLLSFFEVCHQSSQGKTWMKDSWFKEHQKIYDIGFGQNGRNEARADKEIGSYLENKFIEWSTSPRSYSLGVIDCYNETNHLEMNCSYYMMGSIIKFCENEVHLSYDQIKGTSYLTLKVPFKDVSEYVEKTFTSRSLSQLFFKSEIIGQLDFNEKNEGHLTFNGDDVNRLLMEYNGLSPVFAAINYSNPLPIRFAKLIGVSNVCS